MAVIEKKISGLRVKHYSDKGVYILQVETGEEYAEAIDTIPCRYTYIESNESIESKE